MTTIAWFSCGAASAVACKLAIDAYPNIRLVYQEIASAHPDNDRFIADCEQWYQRPLERIRSKFYADQFHVIKATRFIRGPKGARCTMELKKRVRKQFEYDNPGIVRQVFGFAAEERERTMRPEIQKIDGAAFPLIDARINKNECYQRLHKAEIELPAMYRLGFNNNNCIGCVKGGMGYWNRVRIHFPVEFERMAALEREVGATCLKDRYLDELDPKSGRHSEPDISCDLFCTMEAEGQ